MIYDLISIFLGAIAIILPIIPIIKLKKSRWITILSFFIGGFAIIVQLAAVAASANQGDFSAIQDTIQIRCTMAVLLILVVAILNIIVTAQNDHYK